MGVHNTRAYIDIYQHLAEGWARRSIQPAVRPREASRYNTVKEDVLEITPPQYHPHAYILCLLVSKE